jgi:hypothetical protein
MLRAAGLLGAAEAAGALEAVSTRGVFAEACTRAASVHLHIKVGDAAVAARTGGLGAWRVETDRPGFVALRATVRVGVSFSSVAVTEEDLCMEQRGRPFLDHVGLDLPESALGRAAFDAVPHVARMHGWGHVAQGGEAGVVRCCYSAVRAKHWVFPAREGDGRPVPLEFSLGDAGEIDEPGGDLRPARPGGGCCC